MRAASSPRLTGRDTAAASAGAALTSRPPSSVRIPRLMADPSLAETSVIERDRAVALYTFLQEFVQLRTKTIRDISGYERDGQFIWAKDIPQEHGCHCMARHRDTAETLGDDAPDEVWIEIRKPHLTPPPDPQAGARQARIGAPHAQGQRVFRPVHRPDLRPTRVAGAQESVRGPVRTRCGGRAPWSPTQPPSSNPDPRRTRGGTNDGTAADRPTPAPS